MNDTSHLSVVYAILNFHKNLIWRATSSVFIMRGNHINVAYVVLNWSTKVAWVNIFQQFMKGKSPLNVLYVMPILLEMDIWRITLQQFIKLNDFSMKINLIKKIIMFCKESKWHRNQKKGTNIFFFKILNANIQLRNLW